MKKTPQIYSRIFPVIVAVIAGFSSMAIAITAQVNAAPLTNTYLRINRMSTATPTSMRLVFKAASTTATNIVVNMNGSDTTTWTGSGGVVNATQTVSPTACATELGVSAVPGTLVASGSGSNITVTGVTAMTAGTTYCLDFTSASAVTTPTAAGEYHPQVSINTSVDTIKLAVRIVANDSVVISAVVPPTFNFVLSGNTDSFVNNLSASAVTLTTGITATVNTNAKTGWLAWVKGTNTGLYSAAALKTIAATTPGSSATMVAGTEGYATGVTGLAQGSGGGTTSVTGPYDATGSADGSGMDTTLRQIASSTGTAANAVLTIKSASAISAVTPAAADYTDTMTVIGAARF